jgi:hypothetical protein
VLIRASIFFRFGLEFLNSYTFFGFLAEAEGNQLKLKDIIGIHYLHALFLQAYM